MNRDGVGETADVARRFVRWKLREHLYLPLLSAISSDGLVHREINGQRMFLDLNDPGLSKRLLVRQEHEPELATRWTDALKEGMTVIDIGGNLGYYTLLAAREVGERGAVHSIEPHPENYEILCRNVAANGLKQVSTYNEAIAGTTGTLPMYVTEESNWGTLFEWGDESNASEYMTQKMATATDEVISVDTMTLDEFVSMNDIETVNAIRMDLEGFETEVIDGMSKLLAETTSPCWVFLEVHNKLLDNHEQVVGRLVNKYLDHGFEPTALLIGNKPVEFERETFLETLLSYESSCPHVILKR